MQDKKICNIFIVRFLSSFNVFLFFPFFALWLAEEKILPATSIAIAAALLVISMRFSALLFSNIVNKYPKKHVVMFCVTCISVTYFAVFSCAALHVTYSIVWWFLSILLGGFSAVTSLALLSAISLHASPEKHRKDYSYMNIALNLCSGIGPFIGAHIYHYQAYFFPLAPIIFSIPAIYFSTKIPTDVQNDTTTRTNKAFSFGGKTFIIFMIINFLTFIGYAQFYDVFPIFAKPYIGAPMIGTLFLISGIVIVLLQIPFTNLFERVGNTATAILGNLLFGIGISLLYFASHNLLYLCILGVILLSMGEILLVPVYQTMTIKLYSAKSSVTALAIMMAAWGTGESLATFFGVYISIHNMGQYSYLLGTIAVLLAISMLSLKRWIGLSKF